MHARTRKPSPGCIGTPGSAKAVPCLVLVVLLLPTWGWGFYYSFIY